MEKLQLRLKPTFPVYRVTTNGYRDHKGNYIYQKKLYFMRKLSKDCNDVLDEEYNNCNEDMFPRIINLLEVEDGLYNCVMVNLNRDYETGYLEDWDHKLIPFEENELD